MNPYYYLFYRFNQSLNKKEDNEWGPIYGVSVLIGWNVIFIYIKLFNITQENSDGRFKIILVIILASLFILNSVLFLNKKRVDKIMERYEKEFRTSKRIGGWLIVLYILFSLGLIVFI